MQFDAKGEVLNRQAYTPFGTALPSALLGKSESAAKAEPYGFVGKEFDEESGLSAMGSRYYSPKLARFVSADSYVLNKPGIGEQDGQSLNVYSYSRNTPTTLKDPEGTAPQDAAPGTAASGVSSIWTRAAILAGAIAVASVITIATGGTGLPFAASVGWGAAAMALGSVGERLAASRGDFNYAFNPKTVVEDSVVGAAAGAVGVAAAGAVGVAAAGAAVRLLMPGGASAVKGLDRMSSLDQQKLLPAGYGVNPWAGSSLSTVAKENLTMYRIFGGKANQVGSWLTPERPISSAIARSGLSLPNDNAATFVSEVIVPAGTRFQIGLAGPAFGQPGGAVQVRLIDILPSNLYGPGRGL